MPKITELGAEQKKEVMDLKAKISDIVNAGKFKTFYVKIRKTTVEINKSEKTEADKKKELKKFLEGIIKTL